MSYPKSFIWNSPVFKTNYSFKKMFFDDRKNEYVAIFENKEAGCTEWFKCPFGQPGDHLWVRETFCADWCDHVIYKADDGSAKSAGYPKEPKWRPSIHMPRWASRITLEIVTVRVERVQEISLEDVMDEGFKQEFIENAYMSLGDERDRMQNLYMKLWNTIYGKTFPWESNPWCWCISFRRLPCQKIG
jgi:hypothetical protein